MAVVSSDAGTCSYNGIAFTSMYHSRVTGKPIADEAHRAQTHVEYTLEVVGYIVGQTTDATLATMRQALTKPGGALTYQSKGFGDLVVNSAAGTVKDIAWGPWPEILDWKPLGGANAAEVKWRCTVRIPDCRDAQYVGAPVAFNYETEWSIDSDGYTSVRMHGYLEIPMTRPTVDNRALPDNADRYREQVRPEVPLGFQRLQQEFHLSKDKRRLDFNFVDQEEPAPKPDGVTKIDARHSMESNMQEGFRTWACTIEATITLARGLPKTEALAKFFLVVKARTSGQRLLPSGVFIPQRLLLEDDVFGRTARFGLTLRYVVNQPLATVLAASGIWTPVSGTDNERWRTSLASAGQSQVRGFAGLNGQPSDDAIIDLCGATTTLRTLSTPGSSTLRTGRLPLPPPAPGGGSTLVAGRGPLDGDSVLYTQLQDLTPATSWLRADMAVTYREQSNLMTHKPLPSVQQDSASTTLQASPGYDPTDAQATARATGASLTSVPGLATLPADVYQRPRSPDRSVVLSGSALRLGYRVPLPELAEVGGIPVVEAQRVVRESTPGSIGHVPIFRLDWEIEYLVPQPFDQALVYLANPARGNAGGSSDNTPVRG